MKLLFDENLSPLLVSLVEDLFPGSTHVLTVIASGAADSAIWNFARANGFTIVSKDNDFRQRSFLEGSPPKIVWLAVGNAGTAVIAQLLRNRHSDILKFEADPEASLIEVIAFTFS